MDVHEICNAFEQFLSEREDIRESGCCIMVQAMSPDTTEAGFIMGGASLSSTLYDATLCRAAWHLNQVRGVDTDGPKLVYQAEMSGPSYQ